MLGRPDYFAVFGAPMGGRWAVDGCQEGVADGWQERVADGCQEGAAARRGRLTGVRRGPKGGYISIF